MFGLAFPVLFHGSLYQLLVRDSTVQHCSRFTASDQLFFRSWLRVYRDTHGYPDNTVGGYVPCNVSAIPDVFNERDEFTCIYE